jgi:hypothetical protein
MKNRNNNKNNNSTNNSSNNSNNSSSMKKKRYLWSVRKTHLPAFDFLRCPRLIPRPRRRLRRLRPFPRRNKDSLGALKQISFRISFRPIKGIKGIKVKAKE